MAGTAVPPYEILDLLPVPSLAHYTVGESEGALAAGEPPVLFLTRINSTSNWRFSFWWLRSLRLPLKVSGSGSPPLVDHPSEGGTRILRFPPTFMPSMPISAPLGMLLGRPKTKSCTCYEYVGACQCGGLVRVPTQSLPSGDYI